MLETENLVLNKEREDVKASRSWWPRTSEGIEMWACYWSHKYSERVNLLVDYILWGVIRAKGFNCMIQGGAQG